MKKEKEVVLNAILTDMRDVVIGGLVSSQIAKASMSDVMRDGAPAFDKYTKEDIVAAFIGFAMNVSIEQLERQGNEPVTTTSEETPMAKGGQA